jgi:peptidyl-prolyl cis-trans isomerase B (cyclophilin B)
VGQPVRVAFTIRNTTSEPITLQVPDAEPAIPNPEMGLPLAHVFSGSNASGVELTTESGRRWERPVGFRAPHEAPILLLAPHSSVGTTIDLREFFPALRTAGAYRIAWQPYEGRAVSNSVRINIAPQKRVKLVTDDGNLTLELFYEQAPKTVANFVELVESGFYSGLPFHRLEPGYMIQGGCPRGDGTGVRTDGKRIPFEPNDLQHHKGTVSMALLGDDPDSASSQFFIAYTRQKSWDGKYTIFAQLVGEESYETLDRLMGVEVDEYGRPRRTLYIRTARTVPAPPLPPAEFP